MSAFTDWCEIYRSYQPPALAAEITTLQAQATLYSQQAVGNKSYSKDLAEVRARLEAATRVTNERARSGPGRRNSSVGVADFRRFEA